MLPGEGVQQRQHCMATPRQHTAMNRREERWNRKTPVLTQITWQKDISYSCDHVILILLYHILQLTNCRSFQQLKQLKIKKAFSNEIRSMLRVFMKCLLPIFLLTFLSLHFSLHAETYILHFLLIGQFMRLNFSHFWEETVPSSAIYSKRTHLETPPFLSFKTDESLNIFLRSCLSFLNCCSAKTQLWILLYWVKLNHFLIYISSPNSLNIKIQSSAR